MTRREQAESNEQMFRGLEAAERWVRRETTWAEVDRGSEVAYTAAANAGYKAGSWAASDAATLAAFKAARAAFKAVYARRGDR